MKFLQFSFIIILLISCSAKKRAIETNKKEVTTIIQPIDTTTATQNKPKDSSVVKTEIVNEEPIPEHDTTLFYPEAFNHNTWNVLLLKHVSSAGKVNYKGFLKNHKELLHYIDELNNNRPNNDWTKPDKLAYWINAYNAFTVDLILRYYPLKSIKDIKDPWKQRHWKLGDKWYNLDEIEHQVLRKMNEPRIHFAINCASVSCPKLQNSAFNSTHIYEQLTQATKAFLGDLEKNDLSDDPIKLSKIFKWFAKDFSQNTTLIEFLNKYSDETVYSSSKKKFMDYNWNLNE